MKSNLCLLLIIKYFLKKKKKNTYTHLHHPHQNVRVALILSSIATVEPPSGRENVFVKTGGQIN